MSARASGRLCWALLLVCLAPYVVLIGNGHWATDEYWWGMVERQDGLAGLIDRIRGWSPRPLSELLIWLYLRVVDATGRQLVVPFLALLWGASFVAIALSGRGVRLAHPWRLALALLVATLLFGRPDELFYWPMATAAYLIGWAGLAAATILVLGDARPRWPIAACLLVAALSMEIGAATVVLLCLVMLGVRRGGWRNWTLPLLAGLAVCASVGTHRMAGTGEVMDPTSHLAGHWLACLGAALPAFWREAAGFGGLDTTAWIVLPLKLAVLDGLPAIASRTRSDRIRVAAWAVALLLGCVLSIVLALHQFGTVCCVRHSALRQGMLLLAMLCGASLLSAGHPARRWLLLASALGVLLVLRLPDLRHDLALLPQQSAARHANWAQGQAASPRMRFLEPMPGVLSGGIGWPSGPVCLPTPDTRLYGPQSVAGFFHKRVVLMVPWADRDRLPSGGCGTD